VAGGAFIMPWGGSRYLVTPGVEQTWIAAGSGLVGVLIGVGGTLLGNLISRRTVRDSTIAAIAANSRNIVTQVTANSADIKAQIEASSSDIRAQIAASVATVRAQIEADRSNRIWENKAAAYTDAIVGIRHQQNVRASQVMSIMTGSEPMTTPSPVDWPFVEARLITYASHAVMTKLVGASDAARQFAGTWRRLDEMGPSAERGEMRQRARQEAKAADGIDQELMETTRAELLHASTHQAAERQVP